MRRVEYFRFVRRGRYDGATQLALRAATRLRREFLKTLKDWPDLEGCIAFLPRETLYEIFLESPESYGKFTRYAPDEPGSLRREDPCSCVSSEVWEKLERDVIINCWSNHCLFEHEDPVEWQDAMLDAKLQRGMRMTPGNERRAVFAWARRLALQQVWILKNFKEPRTCWRCDGSGRIPGTNDPNNELPREEVCMFYMTCPECYGE
jgi:hypothetical protein